ncbi:VOC family protein [Chitinimonas arctica]|uniref:VOC family protein n=1 Tax=Chitinimonas arctica TaxID=2594795 RepID=A0A516SD77_9NEIS|nr:VOC family protein [Chitinimonas arctica]QDQ26112.1 VOC family protein [Chitinimonas arctica]
MQARLSFITLGVSDLERSRAFYRDILGWTLSPSSQPGVAFFQLNGFVFALYPLAALAEDAQVPAERSGFAGIALAYNVRQPEDVDAELNRLAAAGVAIPKPAADAFWGGRSGYFADPDGYLWEIAWNPGGHLDSAGNFLLDD